MSYGGDSLYVKLFSKNVLTSSLERQFSTVVSCSCNDQTYRNWQILLLNNINAYKLYGYVRVYCGCNENPLRLFLQFG